MSDENLYKKAAEQLIAIYIKVKDKHGKESDLDIEYILDPNNQTLKDYESFFKKENIENIRDEELKLRFEYFLKFDNTDDYTGNHHWTKISRNPQIFDDMKKFKEKLVMLLDEKEPIDKRYNEINNIAWMKKAKITPVLLLAFRDEYGVWNEVSEEALKKLQLWPNFKKDISEGYKYKLVNEELLKLVSECKKSYKEIDLWVLDALLYWYIKGV